MGATTKAPHPPSWLHAKATPRFCSSSSAPELIWTRLTKKTEKMIECMRGLLIRCPALRMSSLFPPASRPHGPGHQGDHKSTQAYSKIRWVLVQTGQEQQLNFSSTDSIWLSHIDKHVFLGHGPHALSPLHKLLSP